MEQETTISESIDAVAEKVRYDAACKRVLAEKIILAWIMKESLDEYRDCDVNEIAARYIEGEPQVGTVLVSPDETNTDGRIHGISTEDTSLTESKSIYDVRFLALTPDTGEQVRLIINVEAQDRSNPGYAVTKRGIYYGSRMISTQRGVEFLHSDYDQIKKVYSIWVCLNSAEDRENTITRYSIREDNLVGSVKEDPRNYDLLSVVMICLGREQSGIDNALLDMLNVLFGTESNAERKKAYLKDKYAIPMTREFETEVSEMCNLSEGVERRGIEKGIAQGMEKGVMQGRTEGVTEMLRNLIHNTGWTIEKAMETLGIPSSERTSYEKLLNLRQ